MNKGLRSICKFFLVLTIVLSALILIKGDRIYADEGKTVRVSTAKQLRKAMKNPEVETIILRTKANINIKIKEEKAAENKFLIIDSENMKVVNKAVFAGIEIQAAKTYTESVSGNKINIVGDLYGDINSFVVSKKKQVEKLTIDYQSYLPKYVLRKGAKIKELVLVLYDNGASVELTLDSQNRTAVYNTENTYDCYENYKITIDKSGRISRTICESNGVEFAYDYKHKYDKNGNLIQISGKDNEKGSFTDSFTYSGNYPQKRVIDERVYAQYDFEYDRNENKVYVKSYYKYSLDNNPWDNTYYDYYEYDDQGRLIYSKSEDTDSNSISEYSYTYDSKGFLTERNINEDGFEINMIYKYNKYGDLTVVTQTYDGETYTQEIKYDKLGNQVTI